MRALINRVSKRLLRLEFKSDDIRKSKARKFIVKNFFARLTMENYRVSCKKYTANRKSSVRQTKQNILMLLSDCAICGMKKSTFIKNKKSHNFND